MISKLSLLYFVRAFLVRNAGDLLLSMRNFNALAVLNKASGKIVWMQHGPWGQRHDPDIAPDGTVTVFDYGARA